ncbi:YqaA family protein [uncultured Bacteroides sp.]|uniref:YqaA family protein n=1 Tax=uncultured Bacteroides sp. TaxID=162156 RepID=UPI00260772D9|nr:YqaA family protein [uncultured Bacteroides sp.]
MDAFVDTLIQLLTDWGYFGLFVSALLAGSIVPFSSELVLAALVKLGLNPTLCILSAALGNTVGGMTCYYMGRLGRIDWIEKYFKVKQEKVERMQRFLQGKGALMAFFAFLPFVGEAIAIALGFMRSNLVLTTTSMFAGKLLRYVAMLWALQGALTAIG